jgi:hypothetical protein
MIREIPLSIAASSAKRQASPSADSASFLSILPPCCQKKPSITRKAPSVVILSTSSGGHCHLISFYPVKTLQAFHLVLTLKTGNLTSTFALEKQLTQAGIDKYNKKITIATTREPDLFRVGNQSIMIWTSRDSELIH